MKKLAFVLLFLLTSSIIAGSLHRVAEQTVGHTKYFMVINTSKSEIECKLYVYDRMLEQFRLSPGWTTIWLLKPKGLKVTCKPYRTV